MGIIYEGIVYCCEIIGTRYVFRCAESCVGDEGIVFEVMFVFSFLIYCFLFLGYSLFGLRFWVILLIRYFMRWVGRF